ncbi:MAG TPA: hypothetical protein VFZ52_16210, partial [Chryseolinea sp.]
SASGALLAGAAAASGQASRLPVKKAVLYSMLPKNLSVAERFALAREVGFEESISVRISRRVGSAIPWNTSLLIVYGI